MDTKSLYSQVPVWLIARNRRIAELAAEGKSYAEIGRMYGLSGERVRQLVERERRKVAA